MRESISGFAKQRRKETKTPWEDVERQDTTWQWINVGTCVDKGQDKVKDKVKGKLKGKIKDKVKGNIKDNVEEKDKDKIKDKDKDKNKVNYIDKENHKEKVKDFWWWLFTS